MSCASTKEYTSVGPCDIHTYIHYSIPESPFYILLGMEYIYTHIQWKPLNKGRSRDDNKIQPVCFLLDVFNCIQSMGKVVILGPRLVSFVERFIL